MSNSNYSIGLQN